MRRLLLLAATAAGALAPAPAGSAATHECDGIDVSTLDAEELAKLPSNRLVSASANQNPALCRVIAYSGPGLPSPAIRRWSTTCRAG